MNIGPIDMVYCWCDGNDPAFQERKNYYLQQEKGTHDSDSVGNHRFADNEELRYSLRSLTMYAPWIHHVYIVTDRQTPRWLNTDYERVSIIDHSEIMPSELIPCFEASIIERYIVNIPGLSEHFLYGNNDMFLVDQSARNFSLLLKECLLYLLNTLKNSKKSKMIQILQKYELVSTWMKSNLNSWKLLYKQYKKHEFYVLAHTIDGYCKTLFQKTMARYNESLSDSLKFRFRDDRDFSRALLGLDAYYSGHGVLKIIEPPSFWKKHVYKPKGYSWICYCGSEDEKTRKQIRHFEPYVFCVNADSHGRSEDKRAMRVFYEQLFPKISPFEIKGR